MRGQTNQQSIPVPHNKRCDGGSLQSGEELVSCKQRTPQRMASLKRILEKQEFARQRREGKIDLKSKFFFNLFSHVELEEVGGSFVH